MMKASNTFKTDATPSPRATARGLLLYPKSLHHLLIQLHSQARLFGNGNFAIDDWKVLFGQRLPQRALFDAVFEIPAVGQRRYEMQRGGDVHTCLIRVIDAQTMTLGRIPADALGTGQASDTS